jgi:hypothetical protein
LLEGAGWTVPHPNNLDGRSLWNGLQVNEPQRHEVLLHLDWCENVCPFDFFCSKPCQCPSKPDEFPSDYLTTALRVEQYKLIYEGVNPQLYDLTKDPFETTNLSGIYPDIVSKMTERLEKYYREATEIIKPPCDPSDNPVIVNGEGWWLPHDYPLTD